MKLNKYSYLFLLLFLFSCTNEFDINEKRIIEANKEPENWLAHARTYDEQRFSPLNSINDKNVEELGIAWYFNTDTNRGHEASPIVVDGVMFTTSAWSIVYALNAVTGELIWKYDPMVPKEWGYNACCDVVNRGVSVWEGKVFLGTIDGHLIALNAKDGTLIWKKNTIDRSRPYTITGVPRIIKDKVIIGNGGAELGVRGYITAYDVNTGDQEWRFYTVPGNPDEEFENPILEKIADTWKGGKWWEVGGGGTVWDSMAYDPVLDLLYIGVGNGSPWVRYLRSPGGGDNLFLSSIVALKPDTGEYVWHYQTTPGDSWDYTATQHMILADLKINDELRKVIMQAPKNGFFYVIDRETGEFLSAENYVPTNWATHVDPVTGRPVENQETNYRDKVAEKVMPGPLGGHNWQPMSYSPNTNLVYIPAQELYFNYGVDNNFEYDRNTWNTGIDIAATYPPSDPEELNQLLLDIKGHLSAWDPVQQKEIWRAQHDWPWNGGVLSTNGNLVFQGTSEGHLKAYTADSGKLLWTKDLQNGIGAPPISFEIDGVQYLTLMVGYGGAFPLTAGLPPLHSGGNINGRVITLKLGGDKELPEPKSYAGMSKPPKATEDKASIARGEFEFHQHCQFCHGAGAVGGGPVPDLQQMSEESHKIFLGIVLGGSHQDKGMVSFKDMLTTEEAQDIHNYIISQANLTYELANAQ